MQFKRGDAVRVFWEGSFGYPQMSHRPGIITQKIHKACFVVAYVSNDPRRPIQEWKLDRKGRQQHPSDIYPHDLDPGMELRRRRQLWRSTATPETIAAWEQDERERNAMSASLNRTLRPILARMLG